MTPATILQQIQTQLKNSADLSYVNDYEIHLGIREGLAVFPAIVLEPMKIEETEDAYPNTNVHMQVAVIGFVKVVDKDKQLTGNANVKGVMDLENDIKKALGADITLSGKAQDLNVRETLYEFADYPERSVTINVEVLFKQNSKTRA